MGLKLIIAGFIFFFLPNISIIDVLPDFIGCILVICGLNKLTDLTPGLADARKKFINVMYIMIAKFFLAFSVPFFSNNVADGGYILIFTFTFGVLDLIFTLPAFMALLDGFVYLGNRTDTSSIFEKQSEFSTLTNIFIVTKAVLATIPDIAYISNPEFSGTVSSNGGFYLSEYKTLLTAINLFITGIIGIMWLVYAVRYFNGIRNDNKLIDHLTERYQNEVIPNKGLFIRRGIKTAFAFITVGGVLMLDVSIDLVNVIPDFLGGILFVIAALTLKKYCKAKPFSMATWAFLGASVASWTVMCVYAVKYPDVNIWSNMDAYTLFTYANIFQTLKYASLCAVTVAFYLTAKDVINRHTGSPIDELQSIAITKKRQQKEAMGLNVAVMILGLICCCSGVVRCFLLYDFPEYSMFDIIFNVIYVAYLIKLLTNINDSVEYRYL